MAKKYNYGMTWFNQSTSTKRTLHCKMTQLPDRTTHKVNRNSAQMNPETEIGSGSNQITSLSADCGSQY